MKKNFSAHPLRHTVILSKRVRRRREDTTANLSSPFLRGKGQLPVSPISLHPPHPYRSFCPTRPPAQPYCINVLFPFFFSFYFILLYVLRPSSIHDSRPKLVPIHVLQMLAPVPMQPTPFYVCVYAVHVYCRLRMLPYVPSISIP
ncbi:hypothetical protein F5Y06DRAFT_3841 [Hypoxylon sp. FL0890]|nr:hypothetical protein F5Y06DRAFT_3841 [Hypoxylon sp. FL0890]